MNDLKTYEADMSIESPLQMSAASQQSMVQTKTENKLCAASSTPTGAVVFRRRPPDPVQSGPPIRAKEKPIPPPKPAALARPAASASEDPNIVVPKGTVKALSKDIEKLFANRSPFSTGGKSKSDRVLRLESNEYEIVQGSPTKLVPITVTPFLPVKEDRILASLERDAELVKSETTEGHVTVVEGVYDPVYENDFDDDWDTSPENTIRPDDAESVAEDPDCYATNVELRRSWLMHGHPTRQEAGQSLKGKPEGAFVVRSRDGPDARTYPYALTVVYKDRPIHMQIQRTEDACLVLAPWKAGEKPFATLDDLVQYYRDNRIAFVQNNLQGFVSLRKGNVLCD